MLRLFCSCCLFLVVSIIQAAIYPDPVEGVVTCKGKGLAGVVVTLWVILLVYTQITFKCLAVWDCLFTVS